MLVTIFYYGSIIPANYPYQKTIIKKASIIAAGGSLFVTCDGKLKLR
jgi:hypothetical protein